MSVETCGITFWEMICFCGLVCQHFSNLSYIPFHSDMISVFIVLDCGFIDILRF